MELQTISALRGPNVWGPDPILEVRLATSDADTVDFSAVAGRLCSLLPDLSSPGSALAEALGHVMEHLQSIAWRSAGRCRVRSMDDSGVVLVAVPYEEESFARECLSVARQLLDAARDGTPFDVEAQRRRLRTLAEHVALGPSTEAIARAARRRSVPVRRIGEYNLLQLGHGVHQRRVWTAETDRTSAIAEAIAKDKQQTRLQLQAVGVPVPEGRPVDDADDAWAAAEEVGLPVVVKPLDGNHGRGVSTNLKDRDQVTSAYALARLESENIVVERHAPGDDFRLLVIGGRLAAAAHRRPAHVIGDGVSTIRQLVDEVNTDPRRGDEHATSLSKIYLEGVALEVLREQGYAPDSTPPAGERVLIRRNANLSTGGTAADVTDFVHPETAAQAVEAALAIGLDIAGVDVVAHNIGRPLAEQGGVVVEVNAGPGLRMHLDPSSGHPQPVGEAIIAMLFPAGENGRIPLVGLFGFAPDSMASRLIAHTLRASGRCVGLTCAAGVYLDDRRLEAGDCRGLLGAQSILLNPAADTAVLETTVESIRATGLGFDRADVAVVGPVEAEVELEAARTLLGIVAPTGTVVVDAAGRRAGEIVSRHPGSVLYTTNGEQALLAAHLRAGGRGVHVRDGALVLAKGLEEIFVADCHALSTRPGDATNDALAAAAVAWTLGVPIETIRSALTSL